MQNAGRLRATDSTGNHLRVEPLDRTITMATAVSAGSNHAAPIEFFGLVTPLGTIGQSALPEHAALAPIAHPPNAKRVTRSLQAHRSCLRWICFALPVRDVSPLDYKKAVRTGLPTDLLEIEFFRDPVTLDPFTQRRPRHTQKFSSLHLIPFGALHRKNREFPFQPGQQLQSRIR
jgi:hypothetical protein